MSDFDELHRKPGHLVRLVHQRSVALFSEVARAAGITPVQHVAMVALHGQPDIDLSTLSRLISLDKSTTGGVISRLSEAGLVRISTSESDRRAKRIALTGRGEQILEGMRENVAEYQARLLDPLDEDERLSFMAALRTLARGRSLRQRRAATPRERGELEPAGPYLALVGEEADLLEAIGQRLHGEGRIVRALPEGAALREQEHLLVCRAVPVDMAAAALEEALDKEAARATALCAARGNRVTLLVLFNGTIPESRPEQAAALRMVWAAGLRRFIREAGGSGGAVVAHLDTNGRAGAAASLLNGSLDSLCEAIVSIDGMSPPEGGGIVIDLTL